MSRTTRFREQHNELLALAGQLQALLNVDALSNNAAPARTALGVLMGRLVMHLTIEDEVLYPELRAHADPAVAGLARKFAAEMAATKSVVVAYNQKWATPSAIKADPAAFVAETKRVIQVLADRIKRENTELYAAADRVEGKAFA